MYKPSTTQSKMKSNSFCSILLLFQIFQRKTTGFGLHSSSLYSRISFHNNAYNAQNLHNRYQHQLQLSNEENYDKDETNNKNNDDEAERLKSKAEKLREQIRKMEEQLQSSPKRSNNNDEYIRIPERNEQQQQQPILGKSLKNKRVLVVGANGRLGSMVTRYLLRNHPEVKEVVAAVHYVGEATTRGYGRLSYEVGAEDGIGTIGAAWSPEEERNASFQFSDEMKSYNLQNLVRERTERK